MSTIEKDVLGRAELEETVRHRDREIAELKAQLAGWEESYDAIPKRDDLFTTVSGREVRPLYTELDRAESEDDTDSLGVPGAYPFTRGPYPTMYRTRLWTMRQFAGFATAEETNERYKYLLEHGQTGLSVAFDFPTLMGYDSDHPRSLGEVGMCGVAISSLADMETLFDGIPLDQVSVSMTINGPAIILFCFYVAAAEKQGVDPRVLRGTVQNDILKEYQAQHAWVYPPEPALRFIVDMFEWCSEHAPKYNPISISGYHIREAGSTAAQELAFTLRNGFEYVERASRAASTSMRSPPGCRSSSTCTTTSSRRSPSSGPPVASGPAACGDVRREEPGVVAAAHALPDGGGDADGAAAENNIVRVAYQAMAAVLGGTQSLHTNSMDETLALPTEKAVRIALRTQQILAYETGVPNTIDPLAGSYYVEQLTDDLEREADGAFRRDRRLGWRRARDRGGLVPARDRGFRHAPAA